MAINTQTLPFINRMLQPASGAEAGQGIADFIGGFMGAHEARSRLDKADEESSAEIVARGGDPNPPHRFENFVKAFNRAPGVIAEGETPFGESKGRILAAEARNAEHTNSLNDQLDRLVKDPTALANEVANLPIDQIPDWLTHNAGLLANPIGAKMWHGAAEGYKQTKLGQIEAGRIQYLSQLAAQNIDLDVTTPEGLEEAKRRSLEIPEQIGGAPLSAVMLDPVTGLPRPSYKREDALAADRVANEKALIAQGAKRLSQGDVRLALQGAGYGIREIEMTIDAMNKGFDVQGLPSIPGVNLPGNTAPGVVGQPAQQSVTKPTVTQIARPPTTAEATKAQEQVQANLATLNQLDSTLQDITLHPEAAGVRGKLFSLAEKVKGTLNPDLPVESATITGIQRSLGQAEQEIFNATRGGIRTSQWELHKLANAGSLTGMLDAPNVAKATLSRFKDLIAGNTIRRMNELKQPISDDVLMRVSSPAELADMNRNGIPISKALVQRYLQLHPEFDPVTGVRR